MTSLQLSLLILRCYYMIDEENFLIVIGREQANLIRYDCKFLSHHKLAIKNRHCSLHVKILLN